MIPLGLYVALCILLTIAILAVFVRRQLADGRAGEP